MPLDYRYILTDDESKWCLKYVTYTNVKKQNIELNKEFLDDFAELKRSLRKHGIKLESYEQVAHFMHWKVYFRGNEQIKMYSDHWIRLLTNKVIKKFKMEG